MKINQMGLVNPRHYELLFEPNLETFKFNGRERIELEIKKATKELLLNAAELKIKKCYVLYKEKTLKPTSIKLDQKKEELSIKLPKKIVDKAQLFIDFGGILNDKLVGFYRSMYEGMGGKKKYLATTQFEAADARRAFPCWDSPEKKATFDVSVVIGKSLTAISNMPITEEKGIDKNKKLVKFGRSPVMSTYLLYLGVGEFEFLEDKLGKVLIRVATTSGKKETGKLALDFAKRFLDLYQKYFEIPYPLPKLDLIAIPDFASGAMENWGAITFRETALLFDERVSSAATKQRIAEVISHEIAHQWFGNLVTMKWWNDLWLNESFATFIGDKMVSKTFPKWDIWSQYLNSTVSVALKLDALKTSHMIEVEVKNPSEISEIFDEISYEKGGSILKMLEDYLGEEIFRKGMIKYLSRHEYGNATTQELWDSLSEVSNEPIKDMMNSWIRQVGYPLIEAGIENSKLKLAQRRFLLEENKPDKSSWLIPLTIRTNKGKFSRLMRTKSLQTKLPKGTEWFKINFGQNGFYRVRYPQSILEKLKKLIETKKLDNANRWGLQNDLFALSLSGKVSFKNYLDFVESYRNEDDYLVTKDIFDNLNFVYLISSHESFWEEIKNFNKRFFKKYYERLGWDPVEGEKHTDSLLRSYVIASLGLFGDQEILQTAREKFKKFLKDSSSLHPDLRAAVYSLNAWQGNFSTRKLLTELYKKSTNQEEKRRFLIALSSFRDEKILRKTLDFALSHEVRSQDIFLPVIATSSNPYGRKIVWSWIKKNWKKIIERHGGLGHRLVNRIIESAAASADFEVEKDMRKFFKKYPASGTEMTVAQTSEDIRINARFLERLRKEFT